MLRSKENTSSHLRCEFVNYLYTEYKRKTITVSHNAYSEIQAFIDTPEGQLAFERYKNLDRNTLGLTPPPNNPVTHIAKENQL